MTNRLRPGDPAANFVLHSVEGQDLSLQDLRGRKAILYFYPAAGTPGCTTQACDFRDNLASLQGAGYAVAGISPDDPEQLALFRDSEALTFPLLSDADHEVHTAYGAWGEKVVNGRTVTGSLRSTFVLDEDGVVQEALYEVQAAGHVVDLRRRLGLDP